MSAHAVIGLDRDHMVNFRPQSLVIAPVPAPRSTTVLADSGSIQAIAAGGGPAGSARTLMPPRQNSRIAGSSVLRCPDHRRHAPPPLS